MIFNLSHRKTLQIQTPEGVVFGITSAGLFSRFLAWAIDCAVIGAAASLIGIATTFLALLSQDFANALFVILFAVISVGYGIFTEWRWRGQSLGKRVLRLRVIDASGLKLQRSQIVIRNLLRPVDLLPAAYLLGGIFFYWSQRGQRLGDLAANTVVVSIPATRLLDVRQIEESKYNSFRDHPHLEARLRQRVTPAEAALALDAVLRRDEIRPEARIEVFREIASHLRSLVPFDERIDETITDERFVRNAVASIYRNASSQGGDAES
jgi:uncharacterized RDD family membrane protein YckC